MAKNDIIIKDPTGNTVFEKKDFEYPDSWSYTAASTFAKNYTLPTEQSVDAALDRITHNFSNSKEIKKLILEQKACFNSPVMFNFGTSERPIGSACFILSVEDDMESIGELFQNFMRIYKFGAGAGINVSKLRGSMEKLSRSDGVASGPLSFMKIADTIASVVKSGGRQRRAAKGVWIDCSHPDVEKFIWCKVEEEKKAKILGAAGYGYGITSESYQTVAFQNMNISIQLTDDFMKAVLNNDDWELREVTTKKVVKKIKARDLLIQIATAAHECGDPGVQFIDTINKDNPFKNIPGMRINGSNPCSEFMFIDNSACNLASINLNKFYNGNEFNYAEFGETCRQMIIAMDEVVDISGYPTPKIEENSKKYRPLGLGFTGLGTMLMRMCIPYGSADAKMITSDITKYMAEVAWNTSHELYLKKGSTMNENEQQELSSHIVKKYGKHMPEYGYRNAQTTLLAPTGTISIIMDTVDSTGIEPVVAIKAYKQTVSGNIIEVYAAGVEEAMQKLGISEPVGDVFATSLGENTVTPQKHLEMMSAAQRWISGAISKTVNLPGNITPDEIVDIYIQAWMKGLKAVAVYRSGSKMNEPLKTEIKEETVKRKRLPQTRKSITHRFEIMGMDGHITVGFYEDGRIGEVFAGMQKVGSTVQGLLNSWSIMVSNALQYGVPIEDIIRKYKGTVFEPSGFTDNPEIQECSSILDYIARFLEKTSGKEVEATPAIVIHESTPSWGTEKQHITVVDDNIKTCPDCGNIMVLMGHCHVCTTCGMSGGCS